MAVIVYRFWLMVTEISGFCPTWIKVCIYFSNIEDNSLISSLPQSQGRENAADNTENPCIEMIKDNDHRGSNLSEIQHVSKQRVSFTTQTNQIESWVILIRAR